MSSEIISDYFSGKTRKKLENPARCFMEILLCWWIYFQKHL